MGLVSRVPFLGRLARRYAMRHKAQTIRAILGLLVATTVLAAGLGLGESMAGSLEEAALARYGPIDLVLRAGQPIDASVADGLPQVAGVSGVQGAATLLLTGSALDTRSGLAEAFATVRGVSAQEARTLGPMVGVDGRALAEPRSGDVILSADLAKRLDARIGDNVTFRVARPGAAPPADVDTFTFAGPAGVPGAATYTRTFNVRASAIGLGAEVSWTGQADVEVEFRAPSGIAFANASTTSPVRLVVPPPVEAGTWTLAITADAPVVVTGGGGAAYPPGSLEGATAQLSARVSGIAKVDGRAAITNRPAALVPILDLQNAVDAPGRATAAYYRATGDPYAAADALQNALPEDQRANARVRAEKADAIERAAEVGSDITGFLLGMGAFTLLAAILLAFTLFSALVEERRVELGIQRALGFTRGEVALSMTLEGAVYAFFAAIAGLLLGIILLWALMLSIARVSASRGGPEFGLHLSAGTLGLALAIGILLPLATIGLASLRFARLDPARAIRGMPDDPKSKRRTGVGMAIILFALGGALSFTPVARLAGIPIMLAAAAVALNSFGWARLAWLPTLGAFAHIGWSLYTFDSFPEDANELDPVMTLARGALLALGAAALAVASPRPYQALFGRFGKGGLKRSSFVALRYLVSRRRPVGLTIAMVALVVVVVTVMGTLFLMFSGSITDNEAGYTVLGESALSVKTFPRTLPANVSDLIARAEFLPSHIGFDQANITRDGERVPIERGTRQYLGVTTGFAEANEYLLDPRAADYPTDRDAWSAVARGEAILFPDWALESNGLRAGDRVTLKTATFGPQEFVVAGGVVSQFVFQTFLSSDIVETLGFPQTTRVYIRLVEGADPNEVAHRLTALYSADGVTFTSVPEEVAAISANIQALVLVFEAFLALGLFVGLAATGFLASRAVHERMRDIGTLRALGFESRDVRLAFILESTLTAAVGLVIGTLAGLLVAHSIWWRSVRDQRLAFEPPWLLLAIFSLAVLLLAAVASRNPAKRAAGLPPAIAVRHVE